MGKSRSADAKLLRSAMSRLDDGQGGAYDARQVLDENELKACRDLVHAATRFVERKIAPGKRFPRAFTYQGKRYWISYSNFGRILLAARINGPNLLSSGFDVLGARNSMHDRKKRTPGRSLIPSTFGEV